MHVALRSLPDVPIEPKLLPFPFDTEQCVPPPRLCTGPRPHPRRLPAVLIPSSPNSAYQFNPRQLPVLEETYKYPLHAELDLGVPLDVVAPLTSAVAPPTPAADPAAAPQLHPLDAAITDPRLHQPAIKAKHMIPPEATQVEWLLATSVTQKEFKKGNKRTIADAEETFVQQKQQKLNAARGPETTKLERILNSFEACGADAVVVSPRAGVLPCCRVSLW